MVRSNNELTYSIVIDAPKEMVWNARTDPDLVPRYFMTNKISTKVYVADFRVGGKAKLVMHDLNGKERTNEMVFREIKPYIKARYDLKTDFLPGKTLAAEETFQDYMDMTMYKAKLSFPEQEDLCKMMEVGWHLLFREYVARFGAMVEEMKKESAPVD